IIERLISTYQKNALNVADATFLDVTTLRTLAYLRWSWNLRLLTKYPRHKLANDGTDFEPGQPIVTPSVLRAEALAWGLDMARAGLIENYEQFKRDLVVVRDAGDPNRVNTTLGPDLVNGLNIVATQFAFRV